MRHQLSERDKVDRRQQKKLVASMEPNGRCLGAIWFSAWRWLDADKQTLNNLQTLPRCEILEIINNNRIYLLDFVRRLLCVSSNLCILFPTMTSSSETDLPEKPEADSPSQAPSQHLGQENL